ncbi:MAG: hypothetical protein CVV44_16030 [Spirochaetae bacterium HGW-Spirochaetae-1]|jgi:benzoyl-CoA reductase/2-hydroxyglutaryl-CoA dehydratase subunit BcrC/BadD/HgdB|nr:MAG: hypothetical protein CVV44_16030 [Spirochaetae bacterium HGW-Spirochaetae-1]
MKKLAYFDSSHDMPEEIIRAAGFTPYKILGDVRTSNDPADQYLAKFFCPAARSWLTEALAHSQEWAGIIFAHGCDATNRHYDIWKKHVETPFLHWFNSPIKNDAAARKFFIVELKRLIKSLEDTYSVNISDGAIHEAIVLSNKIKKRLQTLSLLRSRKDVPNRDYFTVVADCIANGPANIVEMLDTRAQEWDARPDFPAGKKRFLLTGSDVTYVEFMDILDECDIRVVRDDLSLGERYYATLISETGDPLEALADYYLTIPRPATRPTIQERVDYLLGALKETAVDGVLSQNLKFCEPYAYDAVEVNKAIKDAGFRVLHLEREFTALPDQQLVNRLMAFNEML